MAEPYVTLKVRESTRRLINTIAAAKGLEVAQLIAVWAQEHAEEVKKALMEDQKAQASIIKE